MTGSGINIETLNYLSRRIRASNYLALAQIYLKNNFLLHSPLQPSDLKPRLLGHWGTCPGINLAYANLKSFFSTDPNFHFVLGPGHGFPALQANLFLDGDLAKIDQTATTNQAGLAYICKNFSWPDGFPSHASPLTPTIITEGGELGYALANAYGLALGHPEKTIAVLIGDGELETATALASFNLNHLLSGPQNGRVLPILHLNGYKISAPSLYARLPERSLNQLFRGFGFTPITIKDSESFQLALEDFNKPKPKSRHRPNPAPFFILKTPKGITGPNRYHYSHQVPLKNVHTDPKELLALEKWLKSYRFDEIFDPEKGFLA